MSQPIIRSIQVTGSGTQALALQPIGKGFSVALALSNATSVSVSFD